MFPIHLITLEETPEREQKARQELAKFPSLDVKVHRFKKNPIGWRGCINSHIQVFKEEKTSETLWIAEDNLVSSGVNEVPKPLLDFMAKCKDWGIIFVGGYILRPWDYCQDTMYPQVYETRNNNHGTVSYIIHKRLHSKILEHFESKGINEHYDIFLSTFSKCYVYNPLLFYHSHSVVSNINKSSDVWRRVWFHPKMMKVHSLIFFNREWFYVCILCLIVSGLWWSRKRSVMSP